MIARVLQRSNILCLLHATSGVINLLDIEPVNWGSTLEDQERHLLVKAGKKEIPYWKATYCCSLKYSIYKRDKKGLYILVLTRTIMYMCKIFCGCPVMLSKSLDRFRSCQKSTTPCKVDEKEHVSSEHPLKPPMFDSLYRRSWDAKTL